MSREHAAGSWYTVVVVYPDEGQTITEHVEADSVKGAVSAFWKGPFGKSSLGVYVAQVFEGKLRPCVGDWWIGNPRTWRNGEVV
jgi:hypothetical protein